jgi:hypothetical protein
MLGIHASVSTIYAAEIDANMIEHMPRDELQAARPLCDQGNRGC